MSEETPKKKKKQTPPTNESDDATETAESQESATEATATSEPPVEEAKPSRPAPPLPPGQHYVWGTGRRKSAIARVRICPGDGTFEINKQKVDEYFRHIAERNAIIEPLATLGMLKSYNVFVNVNGGGKSGQAGAVSLGLARAISKHMPDVEHDLRVKGLLTRDARVKERKKPGQPGARKHFQFSKR